MFDKFFLIILLFTRSGAIFLFSPLFFKKSISWPIRLLLTLLFTITILPLVSNFEALSALSTFEKGALVFKEFLIGYLLGTLFAFILEGAAFAGQMVAVLAGFSATELMSPNENHNPILSKAFVIFIATLILALDLHHIFVFFLYDTFSIMAADGFTISQNSYLETVQSGSYFFRHGLDYAFIPLVMLLALLTLFIVFSKFNMQIPIFWIGFPIQLLVGMFALTIFFPLSGALLQTIVSEIYHLAKKVVFSI